MDKYRKNVMCIYSTIIDKGVRIMSELFVPHVLKTIEVDVEKKIFRINGEDFGRGCTGFRIECFDYGAFDIRMEVDTTVYLVAIWGGECVSLEERKTNDPRYTPEVNGQDNSAC